MFESRKNCPWKNGPREKWSPEKWSPRKMVPGKIVPGKNSPRKIGLRKNVPGKLVPGKLRNKRSWGERRASWRVCGMLECDQSTKIRNSTTNRKLGNKPKTRRQKIAGWASSIVVCMWNVRMCNQLNYNNDLPSIRNKNYASQKTDFNIFFYVKLFATIILLCNLLKCIFYNTPMISARFHACGAGLQSRFSKGVSTN